MFKNISSWSTRDKVIYAFGVLAVLVGLGTLIYAGVLEMRSRRTAKPPSAQMRLRSPQAVVQPIQVKVSAVTYNNVKPVLDALCYLYSAYNKFVDNVNSGNIAYKPDQGIIQLFRDTVVEGLVFVIIAISRDSTYQGTVNKSFNDAFVNLRDQIFGNTTNLTTWLKSADGALGFEDKLVTATSENNLFNPNEEPDSPIPFIHVTNSTSDDPTKRALLFNSNMTQYTSQQSNILKLVTNAFVRIGTTTKDGTLGSERDSIVTLNLLPEKVKELLNQESLIWFDAELFKKDGSGFKDCLPTTINAPVASSAFRPIQLIEVPESAKLQLLQGQIEQQELQSIRPVQPSQSVHTQGLHKFQQQYTPFV